MKSILLIMPYGSVGGMERLAFNFYNYYKSKGYTVKAIKIIQLDSDIVNFGFDEIYLSKIDFSQMSFIQRFLFYMKIPFLIRKIIKRNKITHSISFGDMANVFCSLTFTSENKIASIHALKSVEFLSETFLNKIFKLAFKTSYRYFNKVVCISNAIKKDLIENIKYKFNNLSVIYNPHDVDLINEMSKECLDNLFEEKLFENKVILFLGRLTNQKAPWHLIKAFSLLENKDNSLKLVLIGDGDSNTTNYIKDIINKLKITDNVFFLGRKSNPYKYLKKASVLALTSYYEGTPNVIVEAIATETPIVTSNCTDGIIEMMSLYDKKEINNIIETESGLITANFFKGELKIPENDFITHEERVFANALNKVLIEDIYLNRLVVNKKELLNKFDLNKIANKYLE